VEVERAPRQVRIERLDVVQWDEDQPEVAVDCSKGTYVRVLAEDIGAALGCGAHLAALRRVRVGALTLDAAVTLEQLEQMPVEQRRACVLPVDALISALPRVDLGDLQARRFCHGNAIDAAGPTGRCRVYGPDHRLLGTADLDEHGLLSPRRLIATA
jgi:tRNA pseudouridine55 synthase